MADDTQLQSGDDLAKKALAAADDPQLPAGEDFDDSSDDEVAASNELAETLGSLQGVIERNAEELEKIKNQLKHKRESLSNVFENDAQLTAAKEEAERFSSQVKERKTSLQTDAQVVSLKTQIGELREQKTELEEALSNHLINYHRLTNSTSFDTSDGDQWEFSLKARVKSKPKSK